MKGLDLNAGFISWVGRVGEEDVIDCYIQAGRTNGYDPESGIDAQQAVEHLTGGVDKRERLLI